MNSRQRKLRRQQLDLQLRPELPTETPIKPAGGWVKAIRESLGMTLEAFGSRLGVSRQTAHQLEIAEKQESISIKRLRAASEALGCELVIYLRPRRSLEMFVSENAQMAAREIVARAGHSMAMEDQAISESHVARLIEEAAEDLMDRGDSSIWQRK